MRVKGTGYLCPLCGEWMEPDWRSCVGCAEAVTPMTETEWNARRDAEMFEIDWAGVTGINPSGTL